MELAKLTTVEIRKMSAADMQETEEDVREQLAMARLRAPLSKEGIDIGQQRKLRRALARLLTVRTEQRGKQKSRAVETLTTEAAPAQEMQGDE